jgi:hypothetical protein
MFEIRNSSSCFISSFHHLDFSFVSGENHDSTIAVCYLLATFSSNLLQNQVRELNIVATEVVPMRG